MKSSLKINYYNLVCYTVIKNLPANEGDAGLGLGQEDPLEEEIATTPVFLPGEYLGQRILAGYSLWGCKELDATQQLNKNKYIYMCVCVVR